MNFKEIADGYKIYEDGRVLNKYGKTLSPVDNGKGYLVVNINISGKRTCKSIHRLLAEAFIPNPNNYLEVNHIDANRRNNSISNLEWVTHGQNIKHSYNLNNRSSTGTNNANCSISEDDVIDICVYLSSGLSSSDIRDIGYPYNIVRSIKSRKTWKHISNNYDF